MENYRAKITISDAQAAKLRQIVHHTRTKYPILYDPRSGINIRPTGESEEIIIPNGKDYSNLLRFLEEGLFSVTDGKLSGAQTLVTGVDILENTLIIEFNYPVYLSENISTISDFITITSPEEYGIGLDTITSLGAQSEAISLMTFPDITVALDPGTNEITFEETEYNGYDLEAAVMTGIGSLATNLFTPRALGSISFELDPGVPVNGSIQIVLDENFVHEDTIQVAGETITFYANPDDPGIIQIKLNEDFVAGDTITVAGETITFYADNASLAAANEGAGDAFGISLETSVDATAQAVAIFAMAFPGFVVTNPLVKQVVFTETVAGAETIDFAVVSGTGSLSENVITPNVGANDDHGVDLGTATTATLQATAISAMSFSGFTVTNPNAGEVLFTEDVFNTETIAEAVVSGDGTLSINIASPARSGDFIADGTIAVAEQVITYYATDADLAAANDGAGDPYGISLETSRTVEMQAAAIAAMDFPGYLAFANNAEVEISEIEFDTGIIELPVATLGTLANTTAVEGNKANTIILLRAGTPGSLTIELNDDFVSGDTIQVAGETITFYADPGAFGTIAITIDSGFITGSTITVAGETITYYTDNAALAAANEGTGDPHGISLEADPTASDQADAIASMVFTGFNVTNPEGAQVLFTETVAGAETIEVAVVGGEGEGILSTNVATPNEGAGDPHGVSLVAHATVIAQATFIAGMTFPGFVVTNPLDGKIVFTEATAGTQTIAIAVVAGTGTLSDNTIISMVPEYEAGDNIFIGGQTIRFYETEAEITTAESELLLDQTEIVAETIDDFESEKAFIVILNNLSASPELTITFGEDIAKFLDQNAESAIAEEPLTLSEY